VAVSLLSQQKTSTAASSAPFVSGLVCADDVSDVRKVGARYVRGFFLIDMASSFPFDAIAQAACHSSHCFSVVTPFRLLRLLRILRLSRKIEKIMQSAGFSIVLMMYLFVLLGHWLGMLWYNVAIKPLMAEDRFLNDTTHDWMWGPHSPYDQTYSVATMYVCSVYWALSVMTNLKGLPAHESRECFHAKTYVIDPLVERIFTIFVFIVGAVFYSIFYGNIGHFVQNLYSANLRYRKRMDELTEFSRFHKLPPSLRTKIHNYVDFAFSVTKGINVDSISAQLPAHLQARLPRHARKRVHELLPARAVRSRVERCTFSFCARWTSLSTPLMSPPLLSLAVFVQLEIHLQLNKKMVQQVRLFAGCGRDFYNTLVTKLKPCICVAGDFVFYAGEVHRLSLSQSVAHPAARTRSCPP
jgi:hypothetical protein